MSHMWSGISVYVVYSEVSRVLYLLNMWSVISLYVVDSRLSRVSYVVSHVAYVVSHVSHVVSHVSICSRLWSESCFICIESCLYM